MKASRMACFCRVLRGIGCGILSNDSDLSVASPALMYKGCAMRIVPVALAIPLLVSPLVSMRAQPASVAVHRAQLLHRGVNASMWSAQSDDYSPARLRSYTTADDIALMHTMGF